MKQFKSSKNQPRWTKTMSILSLSVALQTQACVTHRKLNMFKSQHTGIRNPVDLSTLLKNDPKLQEECEAAMARLGIKAFLHTPRDEAFFKQDPKGNNLLHLAAASQIRLVFEYVLMTVLRRSANDSKRVREMLLEQNHLGYSVLTVAALPPKEVSSPLDVIKRGLNQLRGGKKPNIAHFRDVFGSIKKYLVETTEGGGKITHRGQIIGELRQLQLRGLLQESHCWELIQCLTKTSAQSIGSPTLVAATTGKVYHEVGDRLAQNQVEEADNAGSSNNPQKQEGESNNTVPENPRSVLSQPSKPTSETFQEKILKQAEAIQAARGNPEGFTQTRRNQELVKELSSRRRQVHGGSDGSSSASFDSFGSSSASFTSGSKQ